MKETLIPGIEYTFKFVTSEKESVPSLYPESEEFKSMPNVFATGFMVGLIEWTCIQAINPHIDWPSEQTVGTHIDVSHIAATPPGFEVTTKVKLIEVDGRKLFFEVEAHDGVDIITKGKHERFIIYKEKFDCKMDNKMKIKVT